MNPLTKMTITPVLVDQIEKFQSLKPSTAQGLSTGTIRLHVARVTCPETCLEVRKLSCTISPKTGTVWFGRHLTPPPQGWPLTIGTHLPHTSGKMNEVTKYVDIISYTTFIYWKGKGTFSKTSAWCTLSDQGLTCNVQYNFWYWGQNRGC